MEYISNLDVSPYLYHHGILGMKWGIRRYQNADGTLTAAGKKKYGTKKALKADQQYKRDKLAFGRRGAKKIQKDMASGKTHTQAQSSYLRGELKKAVAVMAVSLLLTADIYSNGPIYRTMKKGASTIARYVSERSFGNMNIKRGVKLLSQNHDMDPIDVAYKILD